MKSILLFLFTLVSLNLYSQSADLDLPRYYIVQEDTVGVILSVEQLQKIDNDLEIKNLLEQSLIDCDSLNSQYIVVVDKLEKRIAILEIKNGELENTSSIQTKMIDELKLKVENYKKDLALCDEQSKKKDTIISNQKKTINKLTWGGGAGVTVLLIIIGALIF